jgi:hypothetical protein
LCAIAVLPLLAFGLIHCSADPESSSLQGSGADAPATDPNVQPTGEDPNSGSEDPGAPDDPDAGGLMAPPPDDDAGAPMMDAGVDTTKWFGMARCMNSGLAFCDSFEAANINTATWTILKDGTNTVSLDTTQHARGNKSLKLHFTSSSNFQYAWLSTVKPFANTPALKTHVFGRLFYKIEKLPTRNMHWTTIEIDGPLPNGNNIRLREGGEYDNFMANYVFPTGEMGKIGKTPFPIAKWVCLEWEYEKATNTTRLWADEELITDTEVTNDPKWVHPTYEKLYVGWQNYQPNLVVPMSVWVDDVALDKTRIGCMK